MQTIANSTPIPPFCFQLFKLYGNVQKCNGLGPFGPTRSNLRKSVVSEMPDKTDLCVLVVEDDPIVRVFIAGYLRDQGYPVVETDTGEEAVSMLQVEREPPIGVVFTDIQLGGELTGWDVAEAFRRAYPDIRVIYASGRYHDGERRVHDSVFFTKPYIPDDIVEAIAKAA